MPLFEYRCEQCTSVHEFLMKSQDPAPEACPKCGAAALHKIMSRGNFVLKGGGWYATDFKDGGKKSESSATPASSSVGTSSSSDSSGSSSTPKSAS
jgi:putative FmdB family regulatory protein